MKVSIVIPTYNHCDDLLKPCVENIIKNTDLKNKEVIIVANGCVDGTMNYLRSLRSPFKTIWVEEKLGFTKATNIGIKEVKGEFVVLLNNDVILLDQNKDKWIEILQAPFVDKEVGLTGVHKKSSAETNSDFYCFYCVMIRRSVFEKVGFLDECFSPGFGEDIDYCKRMEFAGYKLVDIEANKQMQGNIEVGNFPIYHPGTSTFHDEEHKGKYESIVQRNLDILRKRYCKNISIIIPTFNHCNDFLKPCIESIIQYTDLSNIEVIIVANGCTDGTGDYVRSLGNSFKLLWSDEQLGFIKAVNKGIEESNGEYIVLLNNDTVILGSKWIEMLKEPFVRNPKMGITGPLKLNFPLNVRGTVPDKDKQYLMFFCVMIHRKVIEEIGVLDEEYGMGFVDDEDYCCRAVKAGFQLEQITESKQILEKGRMVDCGGFPILHTGGATFAAIESDARHNSHRNNLYLFLRKHYPDEIVYIIVPTYRRYTMLKEALTSVKNQTYQKIRVFVVSDGPDEKVKEIVQEFNGSKINSEPGTFTPDLVSFEYLCTSEHEGSLGGKPRILGIETLPDNGCVCFLDDDNLLHPKYVEKLKAAIDKNHGISYCQINHSHDVKPVPQFELNEFKIGSIDSLNYLVDNKIAKKCKDKWIHPKGRELICHDFDFINECSKYTKANFVQEILAEHRMTN